jgi:biopolymer transport protein TolR
MSMDVGGAKGGVKSDINVTPLVDVMLVLLIIVMLIAPLLQQGVQLTLPSANNAIAKPDTEDQTTVYIDGRNRLYINAIEMDEGALIARLTELLETTAPS